MKQVWMGRPDLDPSASLWSAHKVIYEHGCRPISKPVGYQSVCGYPWVDALDTST
jgi:hypothetical protein